MIKMNPGEIPPLLVPDEEEEDLLYENATTAHDIGVDFEGGEIYLFSDIEWAYGGAEHADEHPDPGVTYVMASKFIMNIRMLSNLLDEEATILIHLNTPGGGWIPGMAIYAAIKTCPQRTVVINYGEARSMSSIIPQAASTFLMMPDDSRYMYHTGNIGGDFTGTQMDTEYREWKTAQKRMEDIYIDAIKRRRGTWHKKTKPQIRKMLRAQMKEHEEVYLNPEEAVAHGFADGIFNGDWDALDHYPWE